MLSDEKWVQLLFKGENVDMWHFFFLNDITYILCKTLLLYFDILLLEQSTEKYHQDYDT